MLLTYFPILGSIMSVCQLFVVLFQVSGHINIWCAFYIHCWYIKYIPHNHSNNILDFRSLSDKPWIPEQSCLFSRYHFHKHSQNSLWNTWTGMEELSGFNWNLFQLSESSLKESFLQINGGLANQFVR